MLENTTCLVPLTQGKFAIVDSIDYAWLMQWPWHVLEYKSTRGITWYAKRLTREKNRKTLLMHREIAKRAGLPESRQYDHKNRDGLCNTRENIRPASVTQNLANSAKTAGKTSQFKGVSWSKYHNRWLAKIKAYGKRHYLGVFKDELEAAAMYAAYAIFLFGEFACFD
jgi:hypothetical protein